MLVQPTGRAPRDSCAQELPFCGVIQGQYIVWERTVYVQTPIDKLPQVFWLHAASRPAASRSRLQQGFTVFFEFRHYKDKGKCVASCGISDIAAPSQ